MRHSARGGRTEAAEEREGGGKQEKNSLVVRDLELRLQTTAASARRGGVEFGQMGLQRGHLQLCVSVQIVLQQRLEDEHVLHLQTKRGDVRGRRSTAALQGPQEAGNSEPYVSLDHLTALRPDPGDEAEHVHLPLGHHHVQHGVDDDEGTRPPDARADRQDRSGL